MQPEDEKILIIPTDTDAQPLDTGAAVRALLDQISRTGDQISRAAAARLAALADQISAAEPAKTEADTAEAEAAAMTLQPLPISKGVQFPLDKVSSTLCEIPPGQVVPLKAESDADAAKGLTANILVSLNAKPGSGFSLDNPLTDYEMRALFAAMGIYHDAETHAQQTGGAIECVFTVNQLFDRMGGETCPGARQRERLESALDSLLCTLITIDNRDERRIYPDRPAAFYRTQLLQGGYAGYITRGGLDARAIRIDKKPVLLEFAERRDNICTVPLDVFRDGENMTDRSLATAHYLIRRIAHMKNAPKLSRTVRFETLAGAVIRATGADAQKFGRKQRVRLADSVKNKLTHYRKCGWIRGFSIGGDAVHIDI